ncbi:MAG: hypothetical protein FWD78_11335 [Treponema sp.]|nr:hypothetical protein [Treponema sp.]
MKRTKVLLFALLIIPAVLFASGVQSGPAAAASGPGGIPSYINLDGYFPVVKQGTNISLTVSWLPDQAFNKLNDPAQIWWFTFVRNAMNIDLKVTARAPGNEIKNIMFASGDLPDIWMDGLTPDDIVNYGIGEKQIMPISDFINPTLMPLLSKVYSDDPELMSPSVASDGKIYGFSNFRGKDWLHGPITGGLARLFYNQKWLDQLGLKVPGTLDEYLNVLRQFKTIGSDVLPDAGIFQATNSFPLICSALGFHWATWNSVTGIDFTGVGTRNGKATFIYGDRDIYAKFLQTYKTMYDEGLITRDFFTMDNNARTAITMQGKGGVLPTPMMTLTAPQYRFDYVSAKPLTSELNSQIFWVSPNNYVQPNLMVITSKCKYPEVVCRMADFHFDEVNCVLAMSGYPDNNPAMNYGMQKGWHIENNQITHDMDNPAFYENSPNYWTMSRIRPTNNQIGLLKDNNAIGMRIYGLNPPKEDWDINDANSFSRKSTYENLSVYAVTEFPFVVYWDGATSKRLTDLAGVINDYAIIQFAQFVTGARPLSELNNYFAELDRLNYQEYLKYFVDYYDAVK